MSRQIPSTPAIDAALATAYAKGIVPGETLPALARATARSMAWLKRRANWLGISRVSRKQPPWREEELELLAENAQFHPRVVQKKLKAAGYSRSATAIVVKRKREGYGIAQARMDAGWYTQQGLAAMVGKDAKTIAIWIANGYLKAKPLGTARQDAQHHDFLMIHEKDVREFVRQNAELIDFGRWNRRFLADVLIDPAPRTPFPTLNPPETKPGASHVEPDRKSLPLRRGLPECAAGV